MRFRSLQHIPGQHARETKQKRYSILHYVYRTESYVSRTSLSARHHHIVVRVVGANALCSRDGVHMHVVAVLLVYEQRTLLSRVHVRIKCDLRNATAAVAAARWVRRTSVRAPQSCKRPLETECAGLIKGQACA